VVFLVTPVRVRGRQVGEGRVQIVKPQPKKFFGFGPFDILGYSVMMSDREKTAIDCIDRPELGGGVGEAVSILAAPPSRLAESGRLHGADRIDGADPPVRLGYGSC
jgi:predicted transcriptional regulator of viral defense system